MFLLLKKLSAHISKKRKYQLLFLFILMVVSSFLEVVSIGSIMPFLSILSSPEKVFSSEYAQFIIKKIDIKTPNDLIIPITLFFSFSVLISGLIKMLLLRVQLRVSFLIGSDFSINMYKRTLYQPYEVHLSRNSSDVITGISGKSKALINGTLMPILALISNLIMFFSILLILFYINLMVTLITIGFFSLLYFLILKITKNKLDHFGYIISKQQVKVLKLLQEGIGGIRDIILDGSQELQSKEYKKADALLRKAQSGVQVISNSPRYIIETIGILSITYFAYYLSIKNDGLSTSLPVLGVMALGAQRLLPTLQQIYSSITLVRADKTTLTDALVFLEQPLPINQFCINKEFNFEKYIFFNKISYKYNINSPLILNDISLKISKGSRLGIIGSSGSGKSTFLDLFMGLLTPTHGNILIDDSLININNKNSWQSMLAHVPQSIFLADTSIAENIAFGVNPSQIDFQKVKEAASKAQISSIIETWDKKYDTIVGERGARLSGGQKQRIGIARALYKEAKIIIFDEATSALDNETESELMDSIYALGADLTIIIVAHRLSTLKKCTQIIEIAKGKILNHKHIQTN